MVSYECMDLDIFDEDDFEAASAAFGEPAYVKWCEFDGEQQELFLNHLSESMHSLAGNVISLVEENERIDDELKFLRDRLKDTWLERWAANFLAKRINKRR